MFILTFPRGEAALSVSRTMLFAKELEAVSRPKETDRAA